ncbi:MAG: ribonuclease R [Burkholderiales bacterium]|jgi:ribonuclease R|nr:ribonuclease R [Burkholderiales bacterium]
MVSRSSSSRRSLSRLPDEGRVLSAVREAGVPLLPAALTKRLQIGAADQAAFEAQLAQMVQRGVLFANRKGALCLPAALDVVVGTVLGHPDGYGFLELDEGGDDLYLSSREMFKTLHGDKVAARRIPRGERGRVEAEILDVLERGQRDIVGRLHQRHGVWFVVAEDRRLNQDFLLTPEGRRTAKAGDIVVAEIVDPPSASHEAIVRIKEVLGTADDDGIEIEIALRKHALPFVFSEAVEHSAEKFGDSVKSSDIKGRRDLRDLPLVTIDGETARDFDDAVYAARNKQGFRLIVAIADVSHYVKDGSVLDKAGRERGTSVYFPRRVIPMLPETLSNGLCSLNPAVDRLVMACDMVVSAKGVVKHHEFYPAVIRSRARLTYTEVWDYLSRGTALPALNAAEMPEVQETRESLDTLYALFKHFLEQRRKRGAIDFETTEMEMHFDTCGKIEKITPLVRNDAHRLIEECMLAANVCAAETIRAHHVQALFRIHEGPTAEKLAALKAFLALCALRLGGGEKPATKDYAKLLEQIQTRDDKDLLQTLLLRSLQRAEYGAEEKGHFGLAYPAYAHFTSPIRRYPDLLVHRTLKAILAGKAYQPKGDSWKALGEHCSVTERRADEATRDVETWLKCLYMQRHLDEVMTGTVSGVTNFGLFVTLDGLAIDGLVHVTELGSDYFRFDAARHTLTGQRGGVVYTLAQRVAVRVVRVDPDAGKIDFSLWEEESSEKEKPKTGKKRSAGKVSKTQKKMSERKTS